MECSPPGFSVRRILQTIILEWIAIPFSRESSQPRDWTQISHIAGRFFTSWATREAQDWSGRKQDVHHIRCLLFKWFRFKENKTKQNTSQLSFYFYKYIFWPLKEIWLFAIVYTLVVVSLSHIQLFATPWTIAHQAPLSMEFSRQEYWSGLPFPSPRDLPDPGIESGSSAL